MTSAQIAILRKLNEAQLELFWEKPSSDDYQKLQGILQQAELLIADERIKLELQEKYEEREYRKIFGLN